MAPTKCDLVMRTSEETGLNLLKPVLSAQAVDGPRLYFQSRSAKRSKQGRQTLK